MAKKKKKKRGKPLRKPVPEKDPDNWSKWKRANFSETYRKKLAEETMHGEPDEIWVNNTYQVMIFFHVEVVGKWPPMHWMSIRRVDRKMNLSWEELQRIKNELIGEEHEAVELFPSEVRRVDTKFNRHLWVFAKPQPAFAFPFGFTRAERVDEDKVSKDEPDAKLMSEAEIRKAKEDVVKICDDCGQPMIRTQLGWACGNGHSALFTGADEVEKGESGDET